MKVFKVGTKFSWKDDVWCVSFITDDYYYALIESNSGRKDIRTIDFLKVSAIDGDIKIQS